MCSTGLSCFFSSVRGIVGDRAAESTFGLASFVDPEGTRFNYSCVESASFEPPPVDSLATRRSEDRLTIGLPLCPTVLADTIYHDNEARHGEEAATQPPAHDR
jgi:hypothetical protein